MVAADQPHENLVCAHFDIEIQYLYIKKAGEWAPVLNSHTCVFIRSLVLPIGVVLVHSFIVSCIYPVKGIYFNTNK